MKLSAGLALPFLGPNDTARTTRERIDILANEIGTGRTFDAGRALRSDFSGISTLAHRLQSLDAMQESLTMAQTWGKTAQLSLDRIGEASARIASSLPASLASVGPDGIRSAASTAKLAAKDIASALNVSLSGRSVFANGEPGSPLSSIEAVLSDISGLATVAPTFEAYVQSVDDYFAVGGTFETVQLSQPGQTPISFPVGGGTTVEFEVDAGSKEVRDALKQAALVAGLADAGFPLAIVEPGRLANELQTRSARVMSQLPVLQGAVGAVEERISVLSERNTVDRQDVEISMSDTLGVDPYEAATRLQNELSRLESMYAITARRSQLRLTDYL